MNYEDLISDDVNWCPECGQPRDHCFCEIVASPFNCGSAADGESPIHSGGKAQ